MQKSSFTGRQQTSDSDLLRRPARSGKLYEQWNTMHAVDCFAITRFPGGLRACGADAVAGLDAHSIRDRVVKTRS